MRKNEGKIPGRGFGREGSSGVPGQPLEEIGHKGERSREVAEIPSEAIVRLGDRERPGRSSEAA